MANRQKAICGRCGLNCKHRQHECFVDLEALQQRRNNRAWRGAASAGRGRGGGQTDGGYDAGAFGVAGYQHGFNNFDYVEEPLN